MVRIIVGVIALLLALGLSIFGFPIIFQNGPSSYGETAIIAVFILLCITYLCLNRPFRDFINENL